VEILKEVTAQDLVEFGFESEFVGRLPVVVVFDELTKEESRRDSQETRITRLSS